MTNNICKADKNYITIQFMLSLYQYNLSSFLCLEHNMVSIASITVTLTVLVKTAQYSQELICQEYSLLPLYSRSGKITQDRNMSVISNFTVS